MNKTEFIEAVTEKTALPKGFTAETVNAVIEVIKEQLLAGEKVSFIGFGTFSVSERAARKGINIKTKAVIDIPASKNAKFKPSKDLKGL